MDGLEGERAHYFAVRFGPEDESGEFHRQPDAKFVEGSVHQPGFDDRISFDFDISHGERREIGVPSIRRALGREALHREGPECSLARQTHRLEVRIPVGAGENDTLRTSAPSTEQAGRCVVGKQTRGYESGPHPNKPRRAPLRRHLEETLGATRTRDAHRARAGQGSGAVEFTLSEEETMLKEVVERFVSERYAEPQQRSEYRASPGGWSPINWSMLADLGLLSLPLGAEYGGIDAGPVAQVTFMEALGRGLVIEPILEHVILAAGLLADAGTETQRARYLPHVVSGHRHLALALFEQGARFRIDWAATRATRVAEGWRLDGQKSIVLAGESADTFIVSAHDSERAGEIGLFLLARDSLGVELQPLRLIDGSMAVNMTLRGAVAVERLSGGAEALARSVERARLAICAEMLGVMTRLFDATLEYTRTRTQFGAPLASFQVIQHRLADLYVSLEQSRSHVYRAALLDAPEEDRTRALAGAKSYVSRAAVALGEECIQLHGAMGVSEELPIGAGHKRLLLLATLFGDADYELGRYMRAAA